MRRPRLLSFALAAVVVSALGCPSPGLVPDGGDDDDDDDDDVIDTGFPAPRDDLTERIGFDETLELAAWNLKNFPCGNESFSTTCRSEPEATASLAADAITSMGVDVVAIEEITDEAAWQELVQRLPHHEGVLSTDEYFDGTYQKIGFLYDARVLEAGAEQLLFLGDDNFPRPALQVPFTWKDTGLTFFAIAVHLKAGETQEDFERRGASIARLEGYARQLVSGDGEDQIVVLGDYNETLTDPDGLANFAPLRTEGYDIRTQTNAFSDEATFLPSGVILDHIVTTAALDTHAAGRSAFIPRLDVDIEGYRQRLSDHLPVTLTLDP